MRPESGRRARWSKRNSWRGIQRNEFNSKQRREHFRSRRPILAFSRSTRSIAFGALHAALDPIERLHAGRRIDALGSEVLDVDDIDPLGVGIVLGGAAYDR